MSPRVKAWFNLTLAAGWLLSFPAFLLLGWQESVTLLLFISVYANAVTHWDLAQSSKVEQEMKETT